MVLWLILTIVDFLISIVVLLSQVGIVDSWRLLLSAAIYLAGKGIIFRGDLLSILDIVSAAIIVLVLFGVKTFLTYIVIGYLLYKVVVFFLMMRG